MVFSPIGPSIAPDSPSELPNVLLFDSNPQGLAVLGSRFGKSGFRVLATGDLARVRELARTSTVSVLLVATHVNQPESLAVLREAARLPRPHPLTCLAFGRTQLREAALAAGAQAFLPVPIFVNDVVSASRLLSGGAGVVRSGLAQIEVSLPLERLGSIYHLIRVFTVLGRSAVVEATRDRAGDHARDQQTAELRFIDGALTSVDVPPWQGLAAMHQILLWEHAALQVKFTKVGRRGRQLSLKPAEVLGECDRFLRDFAHGVAGLGDARTIFAPNAARRPAPEMPSEVIPVLRQFDGQHDLAQILADSPFGIFDTLRIVKRFVGDDAIVPAAAAPAPAAGDGLPGNPVREPRGAATARLEGPAALDVWFRRQSVDTAAMEAHAGGKARDRAEPEAELGAGSAGGAARGAAGTSNGTRPVHAMESGFSPDANARRGTPTFVTANVSPGAPAAANPAVHGVHGVQSRDNPTGASAPLPAGAPPVHSNAVSRRRTPHSMVATGELRIPGNTPPQPRAAAAATLRLVPGVIVDLEGEATPAPVGADHPPSEEAPSLSSADVLTPLPRPSLGGHPAAPTTATGARRQTGVVTQGEIRVARPPGGEPSSRARHEIPSILLDLPTVVVTHQSDSEPATLDADVGAPAREGAVVLITQPPAAAAAPPPEPTVASTSVGLAPTPPVAPNGRAPASAAPPVALTLEALLPREELPGRATPPLPATAHYATVRPAPRPHSHGNPFSDVESDFFNREADLYAPDTVESFDDLDGTPGRTRTGNGPRRG
jgi:CheY-like chemotaxis protein